MPSPHSFLICSLSAANSIVLGGKGWGLDGYPDGAHLPQPSVPVCHNSQSSPKHTAEPHTPQGGPCAGVGGGLLLCLPYDRQEWPPWGQSSCVLRGLWGSSTQSAWACVTPASPAVYGKGAWVPEARPWACVGTVVAMLQIPLR